MFLLCPLQELLSLAKRKRVDSGEQEESVNKPAASTDSETSDSDDEVRLLVASFFETSRAQEIGSAF